MIMTKSVAAKSIALFAAVALLVAAGSGSAQNLPAPRDVPYHGPVVLRVDATDIDHRLLRIRETLPVLPGRLTLLYPQWIPGEHGPTNEVKRLAGLQILAGGKRLDWTRDPFNLHAFQVDVPAGIATIEIDFQQVLPEDDSGYTPTLGRHFMGVQWQGAVLAPAGFHASRIEVDAVLRLPKGWQHASALRPIDSRSDDLRFERVSLETLIDSPVFAGKHVKRFDLDPGSARPIMFDVFANDPESLVATDAQIDAHRNLVKQADRLFGARHFAHYDLLLALDDEHPWGGLEHHQSSENKSKAGYFSDWDKSSVVRDLLPHEFTHSWNGKFRRPRDLWAADFNVPTRNSLLWVYEGQTQYWGRVLAARSGLVDVAEMREWFAWTAAALSTLPGRSWRPLQDTTHDEIIAGRQTGLDWGSWQRFEDYYDEGALIWLDIDTRMRQQSNGGRSLDDFARGFFGVEDGRVAPLLYDFDEVTKQLSRIQPYDWGGFLRTRLDTVGLSPLEGLERSGWRLAWTDQQSDFAKNRDGYRESSSFGYSLGFGVNKKGNVSWVIWDSPAFKAGLSSGPTLLVVNMQAYKPEVLRKAIDKAKDSSAPIELLLKDGSDFRLLHVDYHGGQRYPTLERIEGTPDLLTQILTAR